MRTLATVQRVIAVSPVPNSDNLDVVRVLGWDVVTRKDEEHRVGDKVVFFEIDSFLPADDARFDFLRNSCYRETTWGGNGFRLRTIKLRGQISQGLVMPMSQFPELLPDTEEGCDVTELLRVIKWDPPENILYTKGPKNTQHGSAKGGRPDWIPKTDEIRLQSDPSMLQQLIGQPYYITQKMDGTSTTIYFKDGEIGGCSRRCDILMDEDNILTRLVSKLNLAISLPKYAECAHPKGIAIQGELCGPGIQKNRAKFVQCEWLVFDAFDIGTQKYLSFDDLQCLCEALQLKTVPVLEEGTFFPECTQENMLRMAEGATYMKGVPAEGIVVRSQNTPPSLPTRISFKVINNRYLLKHDE